jgi:AcrR family transcriptional regulator
MARPRTISDEALLAATGAAIGRRGPAFTLADVAREAGVAAGTLVGRFGSKRGLLLSATRAGAERTVAAMRAAADAAQPGGAALRAALLAAADGLGDPESAANHLGQLGADLADPDLRAAVGDQMHAMRAELARMMRRGSDLPDAPAPERAADALLALWNGALLSWSLDPRGPLERRLGSDIDTLIDAWRTHP